jgi:peptide/nickel transport system permease protein
MQALNEAKRPNLLARFLQGRRWYGAEWYMTTIGGLIVLFVLVVTGLSFLTPDLGPFNAEARVARHFLPPSAEHLFGTDQLGRDIFSRIIYGAQIVLQVALLSATCSLLVGVPLGLSSGFLGGRLDQVLSLIMDSIYSFPGLILAIALAALLGSGVMNVSIAIAVVYVPIFFRLVRGQVLSIKQELYVEAARSLGAPGRVILWRYIFPNVIPSVVVIFSLNIADAIITEAALAFIGLGVDPSRPDWGYDIYRGRSELVGGRWWLVTFPGLAIATVALGFSLFGEGLSEILNPRLRET